MIRVSYILTILGKKMYQDGSLFSTSNDDVVPVDVIGINSIFREYIYSGKSLLVMF